MRYDTACHYGSPGVGIVCICFLHVGKLLLQCCDCDYIHLALIRFSHSRWYDSIISAAVLVIAEACGVGFGCWCCYFLLTSHISLSLWYVHYELTGCSTLPRHIISQLECRCISAETTRSVYTVCLLCLLLGDGVSSSWGWCYHASYWLDLCDWFLSHWFWMVRFTGSDHIWCQCGQHVSKTCTAVSVRSLIGNVLMPEWRVCHVFYLVGFSLIRYL